MLFRNCPILWVNNNVSIVLSSLDGLSLKRSRVFFTCHLCMLEFWKSVHLVTDVNKYRKWHVQLLACNVCHVICIVLPWIALLCLLTARFPSFSQLRSAGCNRIKWNRNVILLCCTDKQRQSANNGQHLLRLLQSHLNILILLSVKCLTLLLDFLLKDTACLSEMDFLLLPNYVYRLLLTGHFMCVSKWVGLFSSWQLDFLWKKKKVRCIGTLINSQ